MPFIVQLHYVLPFPSPHHSRLQDWVAALIELSRGLGSCHVIGDKSTCKPTLALFIGFEFCGMKDSKATELNKRDSCKPQQFELQEYHYRIDIHGQLDWHCHKVLDERYKNGFGKEDP